MTPLASLSVLAASPRQLHAQLSPLVCHTNASLALRLRVLPLVEMLESPLAQPPAWPTQAAAPLAYQSLIPLASQHVPAASLRQLHARLCRPAQLISVASLPSLLAPSLVVLASKPAWCSVQPCSQAQVLCMIFIAAKQSLIECLQKPKSRSLTVRMLASHAVQQPSSNASRFRVQTVPHGLRHRGRQPR